MTDVTSLYATGNDMIARYDPRLLGDLVRDDGTQEPLITLPTNSVLLSMLSDAYGQIVAKIVVGDRYTIAQLTPANLAPAALAYLKRLNCDMALIYLKRRRGKYNEKVDGPLDKQNSESLKALQDGAGLLLGINDQNAQASVIGMAQPELIPLAQRNTIRFNTPNYYPQYPYNGRSQRYTSGGN